ncbi:MAG TPA: TIGR03960 family B12-binding radical SAM protein, partial [Polyangiaceae bacterium]|nr:TIGR03960 family B12-binding radical SAM protein [Polyangiaceae bacterium]
LLNDHPRILAERCYTPWLDMIAQLSKRGLPLASLESVRALREFDVVGFSLQYELTYTNILLMLDLGGVPLRASERGEDDPLVIAGGPVATHAEPMAAFFDAILVGDGEEAAAEMALSWVDAKRQGLSRSERLRRLAQTAGVYVPQLYQTELEAKTGFYVVARPQDPAVPFPVERRLVPDINAYPFPDDFPVGGPEAIFDRMSIEVARGCTEGCRFCQAGMIYRPVRERDPEQVLATVESALKKSGQDEVSLTALSTADVSCISPLIKRLVEKTAPERVSLSVASLRAYGLAEELLDDMRKVRTSGLTFAPEAGTQRMRDVINKNVTEAQLMETAERVFSRGFDKMKLYFIIGLPTEQDEDVLGIAEVGKNALAVGQRIGKRAKVTVSVSVHVPKPHTPFQWCKMDDLEEVQRKQFMLRDALRRHKAIGLRLHDSTTSELEGVLARGDRRMADVIERAYRNGAFYDSWDDQFKKDVWLEAFAHFGIDTAPFLSTIPLDARLPWDHIDVGLEEGFLAREYRKALQSRLSPPCGKAKGMFIHHTNVEEASQDARKLVCYDCGIACDLTRMRQERVGFLQKMGAAAPGQRAALPIYGQASTL